MQRSASTYRSKQRIVSSGLVLLLVLSLLAVLRPQEPVQELKAEKDVLSDPSIQKFLDKHNGNIKDGSIKPVN